ncbi:MAG: universal stress protein [Synechococcaceae cyanobacterium SM2_3_1]|nr:universal stress protein [Synechococcaceae cyanobacterium SM2_3_1]
MLAEIVIILIGGLLAGQGVRRLGAPPLLGMILLGILMGPQVSGLLKAEVLAAADPLRSVAVMIILMKAGLGLDREKLVQQGSVALRLGLLPAACEALVVGILATWILEFDLATGLLLGCILGAESPAVIVPGMLRLKSLGWGVEKGIPDAILTGSMLSDVLMLLVFSLLLHQLTGGESSPTAFGLLPLQVLLQVGLGLAGGWGAAKLLIRFLTQSRWTQTTVQDVLIAACLALGLVISAEAWPFFSGYLAVMSLGFFLMAEDPPLARPLRSGFDALWGVFEILLFVLLGASVQLQTLGAVLIPGILVLFAGTFMGRGLGWWLSTLGSNWTWRERLFLLPANSAKATVQAAIGAIPLSLGIEGGEIILAMAALSILLTAPLGAWGIVAFAPRLLDRGEVDPTRIGVSNPPLILAAVDTSELAPCVLKKSADLARRSHGEVVVLHVRTQSGNGIQDLQDQVSIYLADIRHEFRVIEGVVPETILQLAADRQVTEIVMGKRGHRWLEQIVLGSVSEAVLQQSAVPVILVEAAVARSSSTSAS